MRRPLPVLAAAALAGALLAPHPAARADDLIAPPVTLHRLRALLDETVSPAPTADDYAVIVTLHRDMVDAYGGGSAGQAGEAWRAGNSLYDELRYLSNDPTRRRLREVVRLQEQMLRDADVAERTMFDAIETVLAADADDDVGRQAIHDAVERARLARECDRLLASIPMQEPSGVMSGMRDSVTRLRVGNEVRVALNRVLAERDAALAPLLRSALSKYQRFAIAAAAAFDEVFGGVLPKLGAAISEDEATRLTARMRKRCESEAEAFLAVRRSIREREDSSLDQLCRLLPEAEALELRLRLSLRVDGWIGPLAKTEGHVRDALEALPEGDPVRARVEEFAARWRPALLGILAAQQESLRTREDETFLDPGALMLGRGWILLDVPLAERGQSKHALELDQILAPRVMEAGGSLGNLVARDFDNGRPRLMERAAMSQWRREVALAPVAEEQPVCLRAVSIMDMEAVLSPEAFRDSQFARLGVARTLDRTTVERRIWGDAPPSSAWVECAGRAWATHEAAWTSQVEGAMPQLREASRRINSLPRTEVLGLDGREPPPDAGERAAALASALGVRDSAWRAAEAIDSSLFDALEVCAAEAPAPVQRAVRVERLRRFIERERLAINPLLARVRPIVAWVDVAEAAGLSPDAIERVETALIQQAQAYGAAVAERRRLEFAHAAAIDTASLGLRGTALDRWPAVERNRSEKVAARHRMASADLIGAMLDAAGQGAEGADQRMLLERALLRVLSVDWVDDGVARRTASRAGAATRDDAERQAVARAWDRYVQACDAAHERAARLALRSAGFGQASTGRELFPADPGAEAAGSSERLAEIIRQEIFDRRTMLEIDLQGILGPERWADIAPPDIFELNGVGGESSGGRRE